MRVTVSRREHFNAAHRLYNPAWDNDRNEEIFGLCNNPSYHGHNYNLIVKVSGPINPDTGYVIDMKILKQIIRTKVTKRFDHKNLNIDVEEFKNLIPTAENISIVIWNILRAELDTSLDLSVVLYETERNFVEYSGE
jgi:6-pyruvoyltetrahydropterin/6-carboxytetrahydropterin synthase